MMAEDPTYVDEVICELKTVEEHKRSSHKKGQESKRGKDVSATNATCRMDVGV